MKTRKVGIAMFVGALFGALAVWACDNQVPKDSTNVCDTAKTCAQTAAIAVAGSNQWSCPSAKIVNALHTECKNGDGSNCNGESTDCARTTSCKVVAGSPPTCEPDQESGDWSRAIQKVGKACPKPPSA